MIPLATLHRLEKLGRLPPARRRVLGLPEEGGLQLLVWTFKLAGSCTLFSFRGVLAWGSSASVQRDWNHSLPRAYDTQCSQRVNDGQSVGRG